MDTIAITKATKNLEKLERKLTKVSDNADAAVAKATAKAKNAQEGKVTAAKAAVIEAKKALTDLVKAA